VLAGGAGFAFSHAVVHLHVEGVQQGFQRRLQLPDAGVTFGVNDFKGGGQFLNGLVPLASEHQRLAPRLNALRVKPFVLADFVYGGALVLQLPDAGVFVGEFVVTFMSTVNIAFQPAFFKTHRRSSLVWGGAVSAHRLRTSSASSFSP